MRKDGWLDERRVGNAKWAYECIKVSSNALLGCQAVYNAQAGSNPASSVEELERQALGNGISIKENVMFRIAAVRRSKDMGGTVVEVMVDVETALGRDVEAAKIAFYYQAR